MKTPPLRPGRFTLFQGRSLLSTAAKALLLIAINLFLLQNARATLYLLEPYDNTPGGSLTNAIPWSTNGTLGEVNGSQTQGIVAGDLSYFPIDDPTTVNSACLQWSSNVKGERIIPRHPHGGPGSGQSIYCSFMFVKTTTNEDGANLPIVGMVTDNVGTLNSANTTIGGPVLNITSASGSGGLYQLGIKMGGGVAGAVYPPGGQTYTPGNTNGTVTFGQTNLVVMKYTFASAGSDTVALWVNPSSSSFGGSEPAATMNDVAATNASGFTSGAASGLGYFQIRGGSGTAAGVLQMDNVRIGSTWADVTPTCVTAGITSNPNNYAVSPGASAHFNVVATGQNPTYQWQTNKTGTWINIAGATSANYTTVPEVLADNNLQFRCIVNVACDSSSVTSTAATLTVETCVPANASNPTNQTVGAGFSATFAVNPFGSTSPTFQWQTNLNSAGWVNITGATASNYVTRPEVVGDDQLQFRCIVSVACNSSSVTTQPAILSVVCNTAQATIVNGTVTVVAGQPAIFAVTSTSSNPTYQWATDNGTGGATFTPILNATNSSYTNSSTTTSEYGWLYQCTVSNSCDMTTATALGQLVVNCFSAAISTDISNTSVALGAGQTVGFSVAAVNTSLPTYQWQTNNGSGWVNIALATSKTYTTIPLPQADSGLQYQCVVTAPCDGSTATSSVATVTVYSDNAEFFSVNSGNIGANNSWEQSFDGGATFDNPALYPPADINTTNTVVQSGFTVTAAASTTMNRVVVQNGEPDIGQYQHNPHVEHEWRWGDGFGRFRRRGYHRDREHKYQYPGGGRIRRSVEAEQGGSTSGTGKLTFKSGAVYEHNYVRIVGWDHSDCNLERRLNLRVSGFCYKHSHTGRPGTEHLHIDMELSQSSIGPAVGRKRPNE